MKIFKRKVKLTEEELRAAYARALADEQEAKKRHYACNYQNQPFEYELTRVTYELATKILKFRREEIERYIRKTYG